MSLSEEINRLLADPLSKYQKQTQQLDRLKQILHVNPLLIYSNEEEWAENTFKLHFLGAYNQARTSLQLTAGMGLAFHIIGAANITIAKQYALRRAWANKLLRNTFWIPSIAVFLSANILTDPLQLFSNEIEQMNKLPKGDAYLYSSKYVKEKYFTVFTSKLSELSEDSFMAAREAASKKTQGKQEDNDKNIKKLTALEEHKKQDAWKNQETRQELRTDDYYFEINEVIQEELDEDCFFD